MNPAITLIRFPQAELQQAEIGFFETFSNRRSKPCWNPRKRICGWLFA